MIILVSNIGSTSFKFRLFEMTGDGERQLAYGGADRIGGAGGTLTLSVCPTGREQADKAEKRTESRSFADHGEAVACVLEQLAAAGVPANAEKLDAVAFKAVLAGDVGPVALVDDKLLERMEYFASVAPAHNPPYVAAMRMFRKVLPGTPLVAAMETGFHGTIPRRRRFYAVPPEWAEKYGVRKYGFHGASHRYIAARMAELVPQAKRVISCHLGGSSSLCAMRDGRSVATSMGLSPQSGLPQGTRVGEFDPFAFRLLADRAGMGAEEVLDALGRDCGLAALSGTGGDMRDICEAASGGSERAKLAIEIFVTAVRDYLGAYLVELGGTDAIVFTGGIGEHQPTLRREICRNLEFAGIRLDEGKNDSAEGECRIDADGSQTQIWVIPTNEELIVARQAAQLLKEVSDK